MKSFYGAALTGEFNFNIPFESVDWRILGLRTTIMYENGSYSEFRTKAGNEDLIENMHPDNIAFNICFTHDLIVKLQDGRFGLFTSVGLRTGKDNPMVIFSNALHYTNKIYTISLQLNFLLNSHKKIV